MNKRVNFSKKTGELNVTLEMSYSEFMELRAFVHNMPVSSGHYELTKVIYPLWESWDLELRKY